MRAPPLGETEGEDLVAHVARELAQVQVRELPDKTALDVFGRAAAPWRRTKSHSPQSFQRLAPREVSLRIRP